MLDLIRYLLERNAKAVTSRVACSACVNHRTATLRGIVDAAPDVKRNVTRSGKDIPTDVPTEIPTSGGTDGGPQAFAQSRDVESRRRNK